MINVTVHSRKRIKKRCGVNMRSAERLANIAFDKGLSREDIKGPFRGYLDYVYSYNRQANNIKVYGDKIYIFCGEYLVTVLNTPRKYIKMLNKRRNNE